MSRTIVVVNFRSKSACFLGDMVFGRVSFGKLGFGFARIFVNVGVLGFLEGK